MRRDEVKRRTDYRGDEDALGSDGHACCLHCGVGDGVATVTNSDGTVHLKYAGASIKLLRKKSIEKELKIGEFAQVFSSGGGTSLLVTDFLDSSVHHILHLTLPCLCPSRPRLSLSRDHCCPRALGCPLTQT